MDGAHENWMGGSTSDGPSKCRLKRVGPLYGTKHAPQCATALPSEISQSTNVVGAIGAWNSVSRL